MYNPGEKFDGPAAVVEALPEYFSTGDHKEVELTEGIPTSEALKNAEDVEKNDNAEKTEIDADAPSDEERAKVLEAKTVAELEGELKMLDIAFKSDMRKADLIALLMKSEK